MNRFNYMSDIHLEFHKSDNGYVTDFSLCNKNNADYLILAGDIGVKNITTVNWINKVAKLYNKVFYIFGNHEFYRSDLASVPRFFKSNLDSNVYILDNHYFVDNDFVIIGSTLWSNISDQTGMYMNDYRQIKNSNYKKITPGLVRTLYKGNYNYLLSTVTSLQYLNKPIIIMSHHAPSIKSCYNKDYNIIDGYHTEILSDFSDMNIKYWVHGHVHDTVDYTDNGIITLANPKGYHRIEPNFSFDSDAYFDI